MNPVRADGDGRKDLTDTKLMDSAKCWDAGDQKIRDDKSVLTEYLTALYR